MDTQNIAYSILDLATVSDGHTIRQTLHNSLALAIEAERSGYKRIWFAEHHNMENIVSNVTSVLIGYIAGNTRSIRVSSGGIMLPNHSTLIVAEQFGTLGQLYPDRIDLGLGRAAGADPQTAEAIRSDFRCAARSFPDEVAKIQQYFSLENNKSKIRAAVAEGTDIPLYILGSSTDSAHLAAKMRLPYAFASHFASTYLMDALQIYRKEFQPSEFLDHPYTMAGVNVYIADTDQQAQDLFSNLIRMLSGLVTKVKYPSHLPKAMTEHIKELMQHPVIDQMVKYSFVGSKSTVKKQIRLFLDQTQVNELIAVSNIGNVGHRIKSAQLFAEIIKEINTEAESNLHNNTFEMVN